MLKGKTPLIIALALAVVAGLVAWSAIKQKEAKVREGWNLVQVLVVTAELSEGTELTQDLLAARSVPEQFVTPSVIRPDNASYVLGRKVLVAMQAGDPLLWTQLDSSAVTSRLSTKVQKSMVAVTLNFANANSVGGWVRPNDHVNIIGTFKDPETNQLVAITLLQDQVVLATGKITGTTNLNLLTDSERTFNNVSMMVIPEVAEVLVLAQELGSLTLALRNEGDLTVMNERAHTGIATLLSGERMKALEIRHRATIEIIRGGGTTEKKDK